MNVLCFMDARLTVYLLFVCTLQLGWYSYRYYHRPYPDMRATNRGVYVGTVLMVQAMWQQHRSETGCD